jgi:VWFA-related protein
MMPKLLLFLLVTGFTLPSYAAEPVTLAQLKQTLTADRGRSDAQIADQLSQMQLAERLDTARLRRWQARLPGPQSREALLVLADMSAFLRLPAAEIPVEPRPPVATQQQILSLVAGFAKRTIDKLPDFFATRETLRFVDTPADIRDSSQVLYQPLHLVNTSADTVLYRKGRELVHLTAAERKRYGLKDPGLSTSGVFGPMLGMVLMDSAHGTLLWSHWEQGPDGPLAVFRYEVPEDISHYEVQLSGFFHERPAYHGEFAVDPATGSILRLTLEADMNPSDPIARSGIVVEYGAVKIGGKTYICPLKSISVQVAPAAVTNNERLQTVGGYKGANNKALRENLQTSMNDVIFSRYHVFRAEMRMLAGNEEEAAANPATPTVATVEPAGSDVATPEALTTPQPQPVHDLTVPVAQGTASAVAVATHPDFQPASVPHAPVEPQSSTASQPVAMFQSTTRIVYVDVVVRDRHGHIVHGLRQNDFRISEDGHPQTIDYFRAFTHAEPTRSGEASSALEATLRGRSAATPNPPAAPATINMILFDLLDTSPTNQTYARSQMLKFLAALPPGHRIALFILSGRELRMVQNISGDSALLAEAARQIMSKSAPLYQSSTAEQHSNDVTASMPGFATPGGTDKSIIADLGEELSTENFQHSQVRNDVVNKAFQKLAQITEGFNGRKNLFWLADSFPVGVISTLQMYWGSIGGLMGEDSTSRMISSSRIAVYPISVLGLQSDSVEAQMNGNAASAGPADQGSEISQRSDARDLLRQQMENIAEQTGGEVFVGTNNIAGALQKSLDAGENYYSLVYTPTNEKWNGRVRRIKVKMTRRGYTLSYRRTYIALPEPFGSPGGF